MAFVGMWPRAAALGTARDARDARRERTRGGAWRACKRTPTPHHHDHTAVSRRVFVLGTGATTVATLFAWQRFLVRDDDKARVLKRARQLFPRAFPSAESSNAPLRAPLDERFGHCYFDALARVGEQLRLIRRAELYELERQVRQRAYRLFFADARHVREQLSDERWFNFVVYARLHVIATRTSAASRVRFARAHADHMLRALQTQPLSLDAHAARLHPQRWLRALENVLRELVRLGFIGDFSIDAFDGGAGSSWAEEARSTLTVFVKQPVTMQAAQLLGEEQYEQLSPKPSWLLSALLSSAGIESSFEDYYLDEQYRPDAADYQPTQLATQFDICLRNQF